MRQRRSPFQTVMSLCVLSLGLGLALPPPAAAQARPADFKAPQPERDANNVVIPNHYTVTICAGTFFDVTPKNGRRDLYGTPHDVKITNTSGTTATGHEQGSNGTIRVNSGTPGVPAAAGDTSIDYDIIDQATGQKVQSLRITVHVIDCTPPGRATRTTNIRANAAAFHGLDIDVGPQILHASFSGSGSSAGTSLWYPIGFNVQAATPVTPLLDLVGGVTWGRHADSSTQPGFGGVDYTTAGTATVAAWWAGVQAMLPRVVWINGWPYIDAEAGLQLNGGSSTTTGPGLPAGGVDTSSPSTTNFMVMGGGGFEVPIGNSRFGVQIGLDVAHVFSTPSQISERLYADIRIKFGGAR